MTIKAEALDGSNDFFVDLREVGQELVCETGRRIGRVNYGNSNLQIYDFGSERNGIAGNVSIDSVMGTFGMSGEIGPWTYDYYTEGLSFDLKPNSAVILDLGEEGRVRFTHTQ